MPSGEAGIEPREINSVIDGIGFGRFQVIVIILCGLIQASDKMQIQYVSMVGERLQCVWHIGDGWKSSITSVTFLGMFFGAYIWGPLGDKLCRRSINSVCMSYVVFYGCLTALAPNVIWVLLLRFLVGMGVGGVQPLIGAVLGEFMTTKQRGTAWFVFQTFWCFGGLLEVGFAWLLLDLTHGWRYLAGVSVLPMLLLGLFWLFWLPVSPRQSLLQGRIEETRQALNKMADTNSQPRYHGDFTDADLHAKEANGSLKEMLRPATFLRLSLQLAVIAFAMGFSYYGLIVLNVQVPLLLREKCQATGNVSSAVVNIEVFASNCGNCKSISYIELMIPTLADFATALLNAFVVERFCGRRLVMSFALGVASALIPLLAFCIHIAVRITLFFIIRFFVTSGYSVIWLYVLEAYPTSLRTTAVAFLSSFSRIASILMPFVAQMFLVRVSLLGGLFIFSGVLALAAVSAALLPIETKDRPLKQTKLMEEDDTSDERLLMKANSEVDNPLPQRYGSVETIEKRRLTA
uniref:MFS domain-containing protein n=1 Tax=Macrostomum lignano TaxID=282301 RepID=A0A1I8H240_9PLAT